MPIVSTKIISDGPRANGYRAHVDYVFDSGIVIRRIINVNSKDELDAKILEEYTGATKVAIKKSAEEVVNVLGPVRAVGEASADDVARRYMELGIEEEDTLTAFNLFLRISQYILGQGWDREVTKEKSGLTDEKWEKVIARWDYMNSNVATFMAFNEIVDKDPGAR